MDHYNEVIRVIELFINYFQLLQQLKTRRRKFKRWWSKPRIRNNYLTGYGAYQTVFLYLKLQDEEEFIQLLRMNVQAFMYLYNLLEDRLTKHSRRVPLPAELRLCITLNYLAYGDSAYKNAWFYAIGHSTVIKVITEVCEVLCEMMAPIFLKFPSAEEFAVIANRFREDLYFPNCIGALDGRHCPIRKPVNSGSRFWNYKKFYSVVLMACCDSNKRFIWINVGDCGSFNDAGVFAHSDLGQNLENVAVDLPPPTFLPDSDIKIPYFLIGDGGFPIKPYLLKPYLRNNNLTVPQRVFNFRLSHARSVIENAFGLLSNTWLVNQFPMNWKLDKCNKMVMSTVCLHNFLMDFNNNVVNRPYMLNEIENVIAANNHAVIDENNLNGMIALNIRINLTNYFVSPLGSVPFQWDKI